MEAYQAIAALLDMGYKAADNPSPLCGYDIEELWLRHPSGHAVSVEYMKYPPDTYRQMNPTWAATYRHNTSSVDQARNHKAKTL